VIVGLGVDLAGIERVRRVWERHRERFVVRVLHPDEREHVLAAADPAERLAGRWAVKEAAMKALGTGMLNGVAFADICLLPDAAGGRPRLRLTGAALAAAGRLGASSWHASLSHSDGFAVAVVVLEG
jgi:holo-[acyl-carrier protein] synthase